MVQTTVVGTYPRIGETFEEQALRRGIARLDRGEIGEADLQVVERDTVRDVLREQNEIGIDLVTDGQISWYDSQSHFAGKLTSIEINGLVRYFDTNTYYRQPVVSGAVAWKEPVLVDEWKFAQSNSKAPVKAVLTGPVTLASLALQATAAPRRGRHARGRGSLISLRILRGGAEDPKFLSGPVPGKEFEAGPERNFGSSAPPRRKWGWVPERPPNDQRRVLSKTGIPDARADEGFEGRAFLGWFADPRGKGDLRVDPVPRRNRHRHPRRR